MSIGQLLAILLACIFIIGLIVAIVYSPDDGRGGI